MHTSYSKEERETFFIGSVENPIGISLKKEEFLSMEKSVLCRSLFLRRVRGEYRQKKEENEQKNEASRI